MVILLLFIPGDDNFVVIEYLEFEGRRYIALFANKENLVHEITELTTDEWTFICVEQDFTELNEAGSGSWNLGVCVFYVILLSSQYFSSHWLVIGRVPMPGYIVEI